MMSELKELHIALVDWFHGETREFEALYTIFISAGRMRKDLEDAMEDIGADETAKITYINMNITAVTEFMHICTEYLPYATKNEA
jgi:hypothetical protein